jgi:hypothetical protein
MHRSRGAWRFADREYANGAARRRAARSMVDIISLSRQGITTRIEVLLPTKTSPVSAIVAPRSSFLLLLLFTTVGPYTSTTHRASRSLPIASQAVTPKSSIPHIKTTNKPRPTPCVPSHTTTPLTNTDTHARLLPSAPATLRPSSP